MKPKAYWGVVTILVVGAFSLGDFALGEFNETSAVREQARLFREEVDVLRTSTLNLIPNVSHTYTDIKRQEGARFVPLGVPRNLRTDRDGTIEGDKITVDSGPTILFLGGSTTECNEVDEPLRFPALVQTLLQHAGISARTVNGGVRGHTTQDSINSLLNRPGFRSATHVVLMNNINDRLRLSRGHGYSADLGRHGATSFGRVQNDLLEVARSAWDWASYRSNALFLVRTLESTLNPFTGDHGVVVDERVINFEDAKLVEHVALYEQNLRIFVAAARILHERPILMTQPLGTASVEQDQFNEVIRGVARSEAVLLIDLDRHLGNDRKSYFFPDMIHLNNAGSDRVGSIVANVLERELFAGEQ
jgi:lysophospholipase L1-like esterase